MAKEEQKEASALKRERSPSFPYIGLEKAVERLQKLYEKAKRFDVLIANAAKDWGLQPKSSSTAQTVGALLAFGLIEDSGTGDDRKIKVSDAGWRILEDVRSGVRESLLAEAALKPKIISEYAEKWKDGRPDDAHCLSQLKIDSHFTEEGAAKFLKVFDETIGFTKGFEFDIKTDTGEGSKGQGRGTSHTPVQPPKPKETPENQHRKGFVMANERELTTGLLSKDSSFRLIVSGNVGVKEIERLIQKLQFDKEILADQTDIKQELEQ
jgi:hypothetical protein